VELRDLLRLLWKRRAVLLLTFVATVGVSTVLALTRPPTYESTATLAITPAFKQGQFFIAPDSLAALLGTYAATAKAEVTRKKAESILGRRLPGEVATSTKSGTGILDITGRARKPADAATTASATAEAFRQSLAGNPLLTAALVNPAEPPSTPVQPRPPLIIGIAAILGLLAGVLFAFAIEHLRRRVETSEDLSSLTDAPILGRVPRQRSLQRRPARLIWDSDKMTGLQEAFRALRTNVEIVAGDRGRLIEITSPLESQGKSTITANLAVALGQVGIPTAIVDADLRRPMQHEIFDLDNRTGLSTLMALPGSEPELKPTGYANLSVLTSGPPPPDPTEMLHIRFPAIVDRLRALDLVVLIDTPPILPVSDARLIAPHVDGVILVVAAGSLKPAAVETSLERLSIVGAQLLGTVLNASGADADSDAGYYYHRRPDPHLEQVDVG
jgi:capsular exopolysaccharide synthesis family protein